MKISRTRLLAAAAFGIVCVVIGVLFYVKFMPTTNNEEQFNQVLSDMTRLQKDLTASVSPATWQLKTGCDQAHEVYNKGSIGCTIGIANQNAVPDVETMQKIIAGFNKVLNEHASTFKQVTHNMKGDGLFFVDQRQPGEIGDTYLHIKTKMQCSSYVAISHDKPFIFAVLFQCAGEAQRMYYPSSKVG